jgi:hypothetical protein
LESLDKDMSDSEIEAVLHPEQAKRRKREKARKGAALSHSEVQSPLFVTPRLRHPGCSLKYTVAGCS